MFNVRQVLISSLKIQLEFTNGYICRGRKEDCDQKVHECGIK